MYYEVSQAGFYPVSRNIIVWSTSVKTRMQFILYIVFLKGWCMTISRFIIEFSDH